MSAFPGAQSGPNRAWEDADLIEECLRGNQAAWNALVDKYKNLVYSAPVKYRFSHQDADDIFQAVWTELFSNLSSLRRAGALRSWLITVAMNKCFHHYRRRQRNPDPPVDLPEVDWTDSAPSITRIQEQMELEQSLRSAVSKLAPRCQDLVRMLFYADPPLAYSDAAKRLGLAEGSIGFIRGRCLKKLRAELEAMDF